MNWTVENSVELYNLRRWGAGYFDIDTRGHLTVCSPDRDNISIFDCLGKIEEQAGIHAPFLIRFPHLIRDRMNQINQAFTTAISQHQYSGRYRYFFPAKVNQHRDVLAFAMQYGRDFGGGIEVGSKAELLAVLLLADSSVPILCNGFKDSSMVELAFRGIQLGRDVTIIIEKRSDVDLVIAISKQLKMAPKLGIRVKLAARSGGRWNDSGGAKSKFGLSVSQLLESVHVLRSNHLIDGLYLLHFHPGSQISDVRKIKSSIVEAARVYADLVQQDVPISTLDVGGGLAVDYTGQRSQHPSSKNYSLQEYANDVVYYIQQVCKEMGVEEPGIYSESGRALTAHHSMLVVPVLENHTKPPDVSDEDLRLCETTPILHELRLIRESLIPNNLSEAFHDAQAAIETVWQMFSLGGINLQQRSCAEKLVGSICHKIASQLQELEFVPAELEALRHQLADTYIANFSLFQAIPDAWALNQVFPVVPVHRLNERPTRRAIIGDITCDSDGKIDCFVGSGGGASSLALHEIGDKPYYLGIFLIGAYQEALSDDHNLMGNFHVINVYENQQFEIRKGDSTLDVLTHVGHSERELLASLNHAIQSSNLTIDQKEDIKTIFENVSNSYTYLATAPLRINRKISRKRRIDDSESSFPDHQSQKSSASFD